MSKYKVAVYAICKNEEKFVDRWVDSMSEADKIYVLDTGSTDNTVQKLKDRGVVVKTEIIKPWRFDEARNKSLEMTDPDTDICVCTDIDEVFHSGWREKMEAVWEADVKRLKYRFTTSFLQDGSEGTVFWVSKAHARKDFKWFYPVHEVVKYIGNEPCIEKEATGVQIDHYPDKNKSRGQYLELLKLAVSENPNKARNWHYLGREYMYYRMWNECKGTLLKHLSLKTSTWKDERSASMRFIARACHNLNQPDEEQQWLLKAIAEAPYLREPWLEASSYYAGRKNWIGSLFCAEGALSVKTQSKNYINDEHSWGSKPYDLAAVAAFYCGLYDKALNYGKKALEKEPENKRLNTNLEFYANAVKDSSAEI